VIIYFVETESAEQEFFSEHLGDHDLHFVSELDEVGVDAEALAVFINTRINAAFLETHPQIRFICTRSTAFDHIDMPSCRARQIPVANVPDYGYTTVAEHTFALILALSRRLREGDARTERRNVFLRRDTGFRPF